MLVRPVARGLLAHHTDLLGVVRPEDHPAPAAALPVGGGPALRRLLWLRRVERLPQRLAGLHRPGGRVHLRQQQLFLLDRRHCHLPVRVYRQVEPEGGRQSSVVLPPGQVSPVGRLVDWLPIWPPLCFLAN